MSGSRLGSAGEVSRGGVKGQSDQVSGSRLGSAGEVQ